MSCLRHCYTLQGRPKGVNEGLKAVHGGSKACRPYSVTRSVALGYSSLGVPAIVVLACLASAVELQNRQSFWA